MNRSPNSIYYIIFAAFPLLFSHEHLFLMIKSSEKCLMLKRLINMIFHRCHIGTCGAFIPNIMPKNYFYLQSFTLNWHAENTHLKNHENEQYFYACLLHFVKVSEFLHFFCFLKPRKLETYRNLVHNRNLGIPGDIYSGQNSHTGHCSCSHSRGSSS